jgi:hypothetical protein
MGTIHSEWGQIVSAATIEAAVITTLQTWLPTGLHEMESQQNLPPNTFDPPARYTTRNVFDALPGEELPKVIVMSPGLSGPPIKYQYGIYRATWKLGVGIVVARKTVEEARFHAECMGAAARAILIKFPDLGLGAKMHWMDESFDDLGKDQTAIFNYATASEYFTVDVENVVSQSAKPTQPDLPVDDYDYGEVETVTIELELEPKITGWGSGTYGSGGYGAF